MRYRSSIANASDGAHVCRLRRCAGVLAVLVMIGAPAAAQADAIVLTTGESIEGSIVEATRNTVIIRRAIGGMRQMRIRDIAEVRIDLATGETIAGEYLGSVDSVHRVRSGEEVVRISAGRILTRERWHADGSTNAAGPSRARALPPAQTSRPAASPTVAPLAPAAAVGAIRPAEAPRAEHPAAPKALAQDAGAEVAPTSAPRTANPPAAVGRARVVAAPAADSPAQPGPAVIAAVSVAAAAELGTSSTAPAAGDAAAATPAAAVVPARVPHAEAGAGDAAREADSDGGLPAVSASVEPAEARADAMVFRIELSRPAEQAVVLIYGTVDGTAVAGKDYEPQQGVVTLPLGSRSTDVRVPLIGQRRSREARFELFLTADPDVAEVVDQRISAIIPPTD